jgi:DNA-binding CsgD family transcriptional regulator
VSSPKNLRLGVICLSHSGGIHGEDPIRLGLPADLGGSSVRGVATERARARCLERLELLADSSQDVDSLRREVIAELKGTIGFDRWCAALVDPDTLIAHTGIAETDHIAELPRLMIEDGSCRELNSGASLARNRHRNRVGVLSAGTGGDFARSRRWRECLERFGTGDELRVLAADERGCWGRFDLWRDRDDRRFDAHDAELVRDASTTLGRGMRRATVGLRDGAPALPRETGVLLIGANLRPQGGTPAIYRWLRALNPAGMPYQDGIPSLVWSSIGRLLAAEAGEEPQCQIRIRVRAADGNWAVIETARLNDTGHGIAVTVHAAATDEILGLVTRAYGLSNRERELAALIAEGHTTREIAEKMSISRYTVQDHLKSIFDKLGVRSRLELLTRLFAQAA